MRKMNFCGDKQFALAQEEPRALEAGEVRIRNMAAGICGTDVHIYEGGKGSAEVHPPVVLGHEYAGVVTEVGSGVSTVKVGDKVTVDPNIYCGKCRPCKMGKKQLCRHLEAVGVTRDGGFAEYSTVPEAQCFVLPENVDYEAAAMAEPLACCLHGIERAGITAGDSVCVIGGGTIGLLMVQLAKMSGAAKVGLSEPIAVRQEVGRKVGADVTFNPLEADFAQKFVEEFGEEGPDIIIECVGNLPAVKQALSLAGRGGKILLFSVPNPDSEVSVRLFDIYQKELTIMGSFINPDTHQRAADLIGAGRINVRDLITHRFPLEELEQAILTQKGSESIKVLVLPQK
ncbi:MAG: zinc-dependent alcohol dehydrogenase family protein [Eubacteriales bacterium]|nr:zinc-dependent alcohol dehydrogenase family protein [Eubacteriales bacterium]